MVFPDDDYYDGAPLTMDSPPHRRQQHRRDGPTTPAAPAGRRSPQRARNRTVALEQGTLTRAGRGGYGGRGGRGGEVFSSFARSFFNSAQLGNALELADSGHNIEMSDHGSATPPRSPAGSPGGRDRCSPVVVRAGGVGGAGGGGGSDRTLTSTSTPLTSLHEEDGESDGGDDVKPGGHAKIQGGGDDDDDDVKPGEEYRRSHLGHGRRRRRGRGGFDRSRVGTARERMDEARASQAKASMRASAAGYQNEVRRRLSKALLGGDSDRGGGGEGSTTPPPAFSIQRREPLVASVLQAQPPSLFLTSDMTLSQEQIPQQGGGGGGSGGGASPPASTSPSPGDRRSRRLLPYSGGGGGGAAASAARRGRSQRAGGGGSPPPPPTSAAPANPAAADPLDGFMNPGSSLADFLRALPPEEVAEIRQMMLQEQRNEAEELRAGVAAIEATSAAVEVVNELSGDNNEARTEEYMSNLGPRELSGLSDQLRDAPAETRRRISDRLVLRSSASVGGPLRFQRGGPAAAAAGGARPAMPRSDDATLDTRAVLDASREPAFYASAAGGGWRGRSSATTGPGGVSGRRNPQSSRSERADDEARERESAASNRADDLVGGEDEEEEEDKPERQESWLADLEEMFTNGAINESAYNMLRAESMPVMGSPAGAGAPPSPPPPARVTHSRDDSSPRTRNSPPPKPPNPVRRSQTVECFDAGQRRASARLGDAAVRAVTSGGLGGLGLMGASAVPPPTAMPQRSSSAGVSLSYHSHGLPDEEILEQYRIQAQRGAAERVRANLGVEVTDLQVRGLKSSADLASSWKDRPLHLPGCGGDGPVLPRDGPREGRSLRAPDLARPPPDRPSLLPGELGRRPPRKVLRSPNKTVARGAGQPLSRSGLLKLEVGDGYLLTSDSTAEFAPHAHCAAAGDGGLDSSLSYVDVPESELRHVRFEEPDDSSDSDEEEDGDEGDEDGHRGGGNDPGGGGGGGGGVERAPPARQRRHRRHHPRREVRWEQMVRCQECGAVLRVGRLVQLVHCPVCDHVWPATSVYPASRRALTSGPAASRRTFE